MGKLLFKHEWYYKDEDLITDILVNKERPITNSISNERNIYCKDLG